MKVFNEVKVNFWLRRQRPCKRYSTRLGKCPVMFNITASGVKSKDCRAEVYCLPYDWDHNTHPSDVAQRIQRIEESVNQINARFEFLNITATGPMILKDLTAKAQKAILLLTVADEFVKSKKGKGAKGTYGHYCCRYRNLERYLVEKLKNSAVTPFEVNNRFLMDAESYYRDEYITQKGGRKGLGILALKQQIDFIKAVMVYAQQRDYISQNPTIAYRVDVSSWKPKKTYLTQEELERFRSAEITDEQIRRAVDIFLFLCETGMSYCDYVRMENDWIKPLGEMELPLDIRVKVNLNEKWLVGMRKKSKVQFAVPISTEAQRLLTIYGGASNMPKFMDLNDVNILVRGVAQMVKIKKHLTSYVARKTFAHYWRNRAGLSSKAASRLMGHSTDTMINHYADVQVEAAIREVYAGIA
ncbi:site-specific recombinase XerD [Larkinella arboricola]|uniref:Site-specific recombinase XerD n=1 Tax=Larkinella arboricola TaxID=643671 RepID=A0A327WZ21_LARAB|nr:phage integrase SAM-like domain-containing protein [Larkinella arboricola]RAJ97394.1 site-specific recombinase XerD [Larkinella arboricola]